MVGWENDRHETEEPGTISITHQPPRNACPVRRTARPPNFDHPCLAANLPCQYMFPPVAAGVDITINSGYCVSFSQGYPVFRAEPTEQFGRSVRRVAGRRVWWRVKGRGEERQLERLGWDYTGHLIQTIYPHIHFDTKNNFYLMKCCRSIAVLPQWLCRITILTFEVTWPIESI